MKHFFQATLIISLVIIDGMIWYHIGQDHERTNWYKANNICSALYAKTSGKEYFNCLLDAQE